MLDTASTRSQDADRSSLLQLRLQAAGVQALLFDTDGGRYAGGVCLAIDLQQGTLIDAQLAECNHYLQQCIPVTLSIGGLGGASTCGTAFCRFCERLEQALDTSSLQTGLLGMSVTSHQLPLATFQRISRMLPGTGPRYVIMDSLQMSQHLNPAVQQETDRNWLTVWQQRSSEEPLLPAYAASVRTACPLLGDEAAAAVLPAFGLSIPGNTAWLPLRLHLPNFSDGRGVLQWTVLQQALEAGITLGNELLEQLNWPHELQAADARSNRRLAIQLTGIGDLVAESGRSPQELDCLRGTCESILRVRRFLWQLSGELALSQGPLPALLQAGPSAPWHDSMHRQHWHNRWQAALAATAVRNRNLLVLSPYSVLPAEGAAPEYADLLPVIKYADAWSFAEAPSFSGWSASKFCRFHQRAWATIQQQNGTAFVAAGV